MAVNKIYLNKDSYISNNFANFNFGRNEILKISKKDKILVEFNSNNISNFSSSSLNLKFSSGLIPESYIINIKPLSEPWKMGIGMINSLQEEGVTWNNSGYNSWSGGNSINYNISQSFNFGDTKDINCDITPIINDWNNNIIPNNGLLIEFSSSYSNPKFELDYFSTDSHTIYYPYVLVNSNTYTSSSKVPYITKNNFISNISNLRKEYFTDENIILNINNRDKYPVRVFKTSSLYLNNKILPVNSYWAIKDIKTNELVIPFDEIGTKLNSNNEGNFIIFNTNILQPERYYKFIIKTNINNSEIIIDNFDYFKIKELWK